MGFLAPAAAVVARAAARAMSPPPPPDITAWCEANVIFDDRSPLPGPFSAARFPFLREIHEVLNPEHPAREVTLRGSAQWGKTVSVIQPTLAVWHLTMPLDSLVVHPTMSAASEWVNNKWMPMRRSVPALRALFGDGRGENRDTLSNQETLRRDGSLKVASAGSPADLTGTTRRLVILDDLSKFESGPMGDPEALAVSRASGFEDAKILRVSTPLLAGTCRITAAFLRSDQRHYHVPCPHCGAFAPLTWENFRARLDPERLHAAHFGCESCGGTIEHGHKTAIVAAGRWVAHNPRGDHPGFHLWRAYAPQRDWASIAVEYARVAGWTGLSLTQATEEALRRQAAAETEQTFWNDVLGLPYEQASRGPDWEALRNRAELADPGAVLQRGIVPARGVLLTAGVDCQGDRTEVQIVAFGAEFRRWVVDYVVIPHHVSTEAARSQLTALLKATWRTERGRRLPLDALAIDGGAYTDDVWDWARLHPVQRVMVVRGASSASARELERMRFDRRADRDHGRKRRQGWLVGVSALKSSLYRWLETDDPAARGAVAFCAGLGDEYYRQLTSEVRVLKRAASGATVSVWQVAEPGRRNEALDTMLYAEAAARRLGWAWLTDAQWAQLEVERGGDPEGPQGDLFDAASVASAAAAPASAARAAPQPAAGGVGDRAGGAGAAWVPERKGWFG